MGMVFCRGCVINYRVALSILTVGLYAFSSSAMAAEPSVPLTLSSAMADKSAIVCRYNESEDSCVEVDKDGNVLSEKTPAAFAAKKGHKTIYKREIFEDSSTHVTYLKMKVKK